MLFYLSLSGLLLSVILFFLSARLYRSSVYLAGFFFLFSLYSLFIYILFYSKSVIPVSIVYINLTSVTYLIGPMIYWYTRSILKDNYRLRKTDLLHLLPAVIFFVTSLPYIFSPYQEKIRVAEELVRNIEYLGMHKPTVLYALFPAEVIFLSRPLLVLAYTLSCTWMLLKYLRTGKTELVFPGQRYMTMWLAILLGFLFILAVSHSILILEAVTEKNSRLFYTLNYLRVISGIGLAGLLIAPHFFPSILYGLPRIPFATRESYKADKEISNVIHVDRKMKSQVLANDYLIHIGSILESTMKDLKPFLKSDFNLPQLSVLINIPAHHMAYFFREHLHQSYNDYRNKWRVEHAKMMIMEGKAKDLKLEAIGTLSGFSSRNTFFLAFKRAEGISPSEFASRVSNQE